MTGGVADSDAPENRASREAGCRILPWTDRGLTRQEQAGPRIKYAICNWLFRGVEFRAACELVARHGFQGLEIAHLEKVPDSQERLSS